MLTLQNLSYSHPNHDVLFHDLNLVINASEKIALVGNNGVGKSTLLRIIAGHLVPSGGTVSVDETLTYYVPQIYGQYDHLTIAEALNVHGKMDALSEISQGKVSELNYTILDDDWTIEDRSHQALSEWQLNGITLEQKMGSLSGGQKLKVFLSGININRPQLVLLDEPSNHLDRAGRELLYSFVRHTKLTLLVVSHDRTLLNLLTTTCELTPGGLKSYGGNYDFYYQQRENETNALFEDIEEGEKTLRKARTIARETKEREQKRDARGKGKQAKNGMGKGMMDKMKNDAERSTARIKSVHEEKVADLAEELHELRSSAGRVNKIKMDFNNSSLPQGKVLVAARSINYRYELNDVWSTPLNLRITCGERIAIPGSNGSGKTTLLRIILGQLKPSRGHITLSYGNSVYIDQDYSMIDDAITVVQQAQEFNRSGLMEHEVKIRLHRFLFPKEDWDKLCGNLSGGERMRLLLCCLSFYQQSPDLIVLDEPTNNLDIQNIEILVRSLKDYKGTLLVISHDELFLEEIGINRIIEL